MAVGKNAVLVVASTLFTIVAILVLDFAVSVHVVADPDQPLPDSVRPYQPLDSGFYELKKRFAGNDNWGSHVYPVATDSNGFRTSAPGAPEPPADLVFLGDSYTYGVNGAWNETFVGMYALASGRSIVNGGVPSYSPTTYLYRYRQALATGRLTRGHAVVLALDVGDVQDEAEHWQQGPVHPVTFPGAQKLPQREGLRAYLAGRLLFTKTIYRYFQYGGVDGRPAELIFDQPRSALTWQPAEKLDPDYAPLGVRKGLEKTTAALHEIAQLARDNGARFYLLIYPWPAQLKYPTTHLDWSAYARDVCAGSACAGVIDTLPRFRELAARNPDWYRAYYVVGDTHFNAAGNRVISEILLGSLPESGK